MNPAASGPHDLRPAILSRTLAAVLGGYALASASAVFLSFLFPGSVADAVLAASLPSFAIYTAAVIWAFAARSAVRAWLGLGLPTLLLGVAATLCGWSGAGA